MNLGEIVKQIQPIRNEWVERAREAYGASCNSPSRPGAPARYCGTICGFQRPSNRTSPQRHSWLWLKIMGLYLKG